MGILARKVHRKPSIVKQLFIYLFILFIYLFIYSFIFITAILMLHGQLWDIIKGTASLTRC